MAVLQWLRADLRRPGYSVAVKDWPFLAGASLLIILGAQISEPASWPALACLVIAGCAITALAATKIPIELLAVIAIAAVGLATGSSARLEPSFFLVNVLMVYVAWHLGSAVRSALLALLAIVTIMGVWLVDPRAFAWPPWVTSQLFTVILGRVLFAQRQVIAALEEARTELAGQAVAEERRRIARELHDLAGHTLAAMMLHVTGARHVLRRDRAEADQALLDAEAVGRAGLAQVRTTVAALRTTEQGLDPPLPLAADVPALVEDYRRAGLSIDAEIDPRVASIEGPVALAVARICSEALANVARHAPENNVDVTVTIEADKTLRLGVQDRGQAPAWGTSSAGGFGVIGMGERARSLGGTLRAGPTRDGWRIEASLPCAPALTQADHR